MIIPQWSALRLRVVLYRKHVGHETRKNFQLDLFTPDDGHYEYSAVATNLPLGLSALWPFVCGRGAQEKTFAELKGEFALDVVPTKHYAANSARQQLSILAYNLTRSFQLETLAIPKARSRKRTYGYLFCGIGSWGGRRLSTAITSGGGGPRPGRPRRRRGLELAMLSSNSSAPWINTASRRNSPYET